MQVGCCRYSRIAGDSCISKNSDEFFFSSRLERVEKPPQREGRHKPTFIVLMNHPDPERSCKPERSKEIFHFI